MSKVKVGDRVSFAYPPANPFYVGKGDVLRVERTYAIIRPDGEKYGKVFANNEFKKLVEHKVTSIEEYEKKYEVEHLRRICAIVNRHETWTPELADKVWKRCCDYGFTCCSDSNWEIAKGRYYMAAFDTNRKANVYSIKKW